MIRIGTALHSSRTALFFTIRCELPRDGWKAQKHRVFPASKTGITVATYRLTTLILFTAGALLQADSLKTKTDGRRRAPWSSYRASHGRLTQGKGGWKCQTLRTRQASTTVQHAASHSIRSWNCGSTRKTAFRSQLRQPLHRSRRHPARARSGESPLYALRTVWSGNHGVRAPVNSYV